MHKGVHHQIDGIVKGHHKARHVGVGDGDGLACLHLLHPQRDNASARCHHIAIAGATDGGWRIVAQSASLRYGHLLHHSLRNAHGIDGVSSLVGAEHHNIFHTMLNGRQQHVVGAIDIGAHGLHGKKLARWNLL